MKIFYITTYRIYIRSENFLLTCEICGKKSDIHHIVYRSEGGYNFELNYKYLCDEHHRGKDGPHRNKKVDLKYKLELQEKLYELLSKEYYKQEDIKIILSLNVNQVKRLVRNLKLYKEGYKSSDVIFEIMGDKKYDSSMLEEYEDFIVI